MGFENAFWGRAVAATEILLYLVGSLGAIGLLALVQHVMGRSRSGRIADADEARALFLADYPEADCGDAAVTAAGDAALIVAAEGGRRGAGLVRSLGAFWQTRFVAEGELARSRLIRDTDVMLTFFDFTAPAVTLRFADPATAALWHERLAALTPAAVSGPRAAA